MKLMRYLLLAFVVMSMTSCASTAINLFNKKIKPVEGMSEPISHDIWDDLLERHVQADGNMDYNALSKERDKFDQYITLLEANHPNPMHWSKDESIAYWINAYNAFTVQQVLDHYPIGSIKDIKGGITFISSIWDQKFINIEGREYDLNNIEQGILRKYYKEPRIHFAVNCASISCPPLANFAFTGDELEEQLDLMTRMFLADTSKNIITPDRLELSKIFNWYKGDFTDGQNLQEYINKYTSVNVDRKAKIKFLPYDWGLNDSNNIESTTNKEEKVLPDVSLEDDTK